MCVKPGQVYELTVDVFAYEGRRCVWVRSKGVRLEVERVEGVNVWFKDEPVSMYDETLTSRAKLVQDR